MIVDLPYIQKLCASLARVVDERKIPAPARVFELCQLDLNKGLVPVLVPNLPSARAYRELVEKLHSELLGTNIVGLDEIVEAEGENVFDSRARGESLCFTLSPTQWRNQGLAVDSFRKKGGVVRPMDLTTSLLYMINVCCVLSDPAVNKHPMKAGGVSEQAVCYSDKKPFHVHTVNVGANPQKTETRLHHFVVTTSVNREALAPFFLNEFSSKE